MIPFFSRRNQVYPVLWQGRRAVEKHFSDFDDWKREEALYARLQNRLPLPEVLQRQPGCLTLSFCPGCTLLDVLEEQERTFFSPLPWLALARWLRQCAALCGMLPADGNLRNFLWDGTRVLGLDLESFRAVSRFDECGAGVIAALLAYDPPGTEVKNQVAALLSRELNVPETALVAAEEALSRRRQKRPARTFSGIVLAGGMSRRMGRCKAELQLLGRSLLQWQVEKLRKLGITDILISSGTERSMPGVRTIPDILPERGPLGGLHACLSQAENAQCVVLSVDTPLTPVNVLDKLCREYERGVTVLRCGEAEEPLIGVYPRGLSEKLQPLIQHGGAPVRLVKTVSHWESFAYLGPPEYLLNCNTPQNFHEAERVLKTYLESGLPVCF